VIGERRRRSGLRRGALGLGLALGVVGCGGPGPSDAPAWTVPPDWVTVSAADGGLQVMLPPWLVVFDNVGAIFANEPPLPGEQIPMQLMLLPPRSEIQPGPGQDLGAWVASRLLGTGRGIAVVRRVTLPAGPAVRFERVDRAGTATAWRFLAFAIETPAGVAYLQLDGPPDGWAAREADLERIPTLLRFR
jgi:hypothetical protein